jgi:hypothetical protein
MFHVFYYLAILVEVLAKRIPISTSLDVFVSDALPHKVRLTGMWYPVTVWDLVLQKSVSIECATAERHRQ